MMFFWAEVTGVYSYTTEAFTCIFQKNNYVKAYKILKQF